MTTRGSYKRHSAFENLQADFAPFPDRFQRDATVDLHARLIPIPVRPQVIVSHQGLCQLSSVCSQRVRTDDNGAGSFVGLF